MQITGRGGAVRPEYVETVTGYRAWIEFASFGGSLQSPFFGWQFQVVRQPDWLSARLRATKVGTTYASVQFSTPSGVVVTLMNPMFAGYGPGWWGDPTHPKPNVPLEMVAYQCQMISVNNLLVGSGYNWWKLNA
jgi:hypothetical protein